MSNYTNISLEPVGEIDGYPISPCVKSGFCCTKSPCGFGEWNEDKTACAHLQPPNDIGQRDCGKYQWIMENAPCPELYPAFGGGCCMAMFNTMRNKVIENIKQLK